ncbi:MAG: Abi family protein [Muribaculaceae bacterium]|nr:Abi family protein [Muribaculaceae bacterium]
MGQKAITLDKQIDLLRSRGMIINDVEKAKEVLLDVGYYRLGFYWFPLEKSYPEKRNRTHEFAAGTNFDDAVKLYYFDYKLRSILSYNINRIEINFRNFLTYTLSNNYIGNPQWFVDDSIVEEQFVQTFDSSVYTASFKLNAVIMHHHRTHQGDKYAPAWKTIEYMTFGSVLNLYKAIKDRSLKIEIAKHYGIRYIEILENYLEIVRELRNFCAHGNVLYDFVPFKYIRRGPAKVKGAKNFRNLNGSIAVVLYMLKQVSVNRYNEMVGDLQSLIKHYSQAPKVAEIISNISGLDASQIK